MLVTYFYTATFYVDSWWGPTAIFIAAAVTDWLDGWDTFPASLGQQSFSLALTSDTLVIWPLKKLYVFEMITMSAVREWAASQGGKLSELAVNNLGKWKTATQMIALTILLLTSLSEAASLVGSGVILLYIYQRGLLCGLCCAASDNKY
uniref:Phosphatidylglycerophosphate synthase n=1 Tax=Solanum tuberosum TaxID=4113 RepID=M1AZ91_SOLTU